MLLGAAISATAEGVTWLRYPAISPDGKSVAFTYKDDIWIVGIQGGTAKRFTNNRAYDYAPAWSPDGSEIYFSANLQVSAQSRMYPQPIYQTELYASPVEGGRPRPITEVTTEDISFVGTDGDFLYHDRKGGRDSEWRKHHTSSIWRAVEIHYIEVRLACWYAYSGNYDCCI